MVPITVITFFDITPTGIYRPYDNAIIPFNKCGNHITNKAEWELAKSQQSNYNVLIQILMLRTHIADFAKTVKITHNSHKAWKLQCEIPDIAVYGDNFEILIQDAMHVPMITNLTETYNTYDYIYPNKNTWFIKDN